MVSTMFRVCDNIEIVLKCARLTWIIQRAEMRSKRILKQTYFLFTKNNCLLNIIFSGTNWNWLMVRFGWLIVSMCQWAIFFQRSYYKQSVTVHMLYPSIMTVWMWMNQCHLGKTKFVQSVSQSMCRCLENVCYLLLGPRLDIIPCVRQPWSSVIDMI